MPEYRLRPRALQDLDGIWDYSAATWSDEQADRYVDTLFDMLDELAAAPMRGRAAYDIRDGYRRQRCGSHVIFYRAADYGIDVIRVLHAQMNISAQLADEVD